MTKLSRASATAFQAITEAATGHAQRMFHIALRGAGCRAQQMLGRLAATALPATQPCLVPVRVQPGPNGAKAGFRGRTI
ncbi:hypothetical protein M8756_01550 [Lutimaribacter sp. EGI FJ00015]|uniref:Uncharacterized protein n=1 Tax=Lutimaribacter degradans TaxID=2945989 RepID=A0ACC5ZUK9_9RHOB|nr:hypothetical protein [Lutimaribacter sp. EGI FJ00013]MCM2561074.1 hypothetical protein [Lutimaribacter sp. EGI FJ00013]MCO0611977.1 hypothetical protein [Lutimaribacter sp. EGI FJ00015]MCO0634902.1 hypothetical protein [Lutimaribacter sp. EGI FJ00014]